MVLRWEAGSRAAVERVDPRVAEVVEEQGAVAQAAEDSHSAAGLRFPSAEEVVADAASSIALWGVAMRPACASQAIRLRRVESRVKPVRSVQRCAFKFRRCAIKARNPRLRGLKPVSDIIQRLQ